MSFTSEIVQVNPYTATFAAFLVGLFTDKAYLSSKAFSFQSDAKAQLAPSETIPIRNDKSYSSYKTYSLPPLSM
jgi:hypothetical protein